MTPDRLKSLNSIADVRLASRRILPRPIFDLIDGAAEDEWTLRRNNSAFGHLAFLPKTLDGTPARDLSVTLFGHRLKMPVMIGPTALQGLFWPDGERAAARAAIAAGTGYALSHGSVCTMEVLAETGIVPRFMQIFVYRDRSFTHEFIDRAAAAGYQGLILTIDNQLGGNRERDLRNGFTIPPKLGPKQVGAMAIKAGWAWRMRNSLRGLSFGNYVRNGKPLDFRSREVRVAEMFDTGMSWSDVDDIRKRWKGTFLLKGLVHPDEARRAVEHGVDGIVVSNHGGRQLDGDDQFDRGAAARRRRGRRPHSGADRRWLPPRRRRGQGALPRRQHRPHRPAESLGPCGGRRSRRGAGPRNLPERDRPGDGPTRCEPGRRP